MVSTIYQEVQQFSEAIRNRDMPVIVDLLPNVYANDKASITSLCRYSILSNDFNTVEILINYRELTSFFLERNKRLYCSFEMYLFIIKILDLEFEEYMKFIRIFYDRKNSRYRKANGFIQKRKQSYRSLSDEDKTAFDLMFL